MLGDRVSTGHSDDCFSDEVEKPYCNHSVYLLTVLSIRVVMRHPADQGQNRNRQDIATNILTLPCWIRSNEERIADMGQNQILQACKPESREIDALNGPVNRNIIVAGHRTSIRLERVMWDALREICQRERISLHEIATQIAATQSSTASFTAAVRIFIMAYFRAAATDEGHRRAGHGMQTISGDTAVGPSVVRLPSMQATAKK